MAALIKELALQKNYVTANLGMGINGLISGTLSRVNEIIIGKYVVKNVIAAFPDSNIKALSVPRDGNIGIGLVKKFDVIFDYPDSVMYLKPGPSYRKKDEHDMSGLVYYADTDDDGQHILITKIEPGSAGEAAGLQADDEIVDINFRSTTQFSLQQIDEMFKSANGRTFVLGIGRNKKYIPILLTLKRRI